MSKHSDQTIAVPEPKNPQKWGSVWFVFHLATVYLLANFCTPWLGRWTYDELLPLLQISTTLSAYEFIYSNLLAFGVIPALVAGFVNARFKHRAAIFVWVVPTTVLVYKLATFSSPHSVLYSSPSFPSLHYYFGGGFVIPAFHNWREFWDAAASNPDMARGIAQLTYTAPLYAGLAYSLSAWFSMRWDLTNKAAKKVEQWEESRFGSRQDNQENGPSPSPSYPEINGTSDSPET